MSAWVMTFGGLAAGAGAAVAGGMLAIRRYVRRARNDYQRRPQLWNRFYALDWGDNTTNNYGFAPACGEGAQRFQEQMYRELLARLRSKQPITPGMSLLEVSCGRGGGLAAFLAEAPGVFDAVGLDIASSAVEYCRRRYAGSGSLRFVQGSALSLPFHDSTFDVVLNVEASNDYGDRAGFFREVARVLKPGGVFLYADSLRSTRVKAARRDLLAAGLAAEFEDITANVLEACRLDTPRRRRVLRDHLPIAGRLMFRRQLRNYAGLEGSRKFCAFADGRRTYLMSAGVKR